MSWLKLSVALLQITAIVLRFLDREALRNELLQQQLDAVNLFIRDAKEVEDRVGHMSERDIDNGLQSFIRDEAPVGSQQLLFDYKAHHDLAEGRVNYGDEEANSHGEHQMELPLWEDKRE